MTRVEDWPARKQVNNTRNAACMHLEVGWLVFSSSTYVLPDRAYSRFVLIDQYFTGTIKDCVIWMFCMWYVIGILQKPEILRGTSHLNKVFESVHCDLWIVIQFWEKLSLIRHWINMILWALRYFLEVASSVKFVRKVDIRIRNTSISSLLAPSMPSSRAYRCAKCKKTVSCGTKLLSKLTMTLWNLYGHDINRKKVLYVYRS